MQTKQRYPLLVLLSTLLLASCSKEAENQQHTEVQTDPVTQAGYPAQLLWGDTHLHTSNSIDAFGFGNRLDTEAALRFA